MVKVRTRIAPSPTGRMHIGTVRTALFNYLFAKHHKGDFLVRIEDTDRERSEKKWEAAIYEDFKWCGFEADETCRQSERIDLHKKALKKIIDRGVAYVSKEPSQKNPEETVEVVRLKNPGKKITFQDEIRGAVTFDTTELKDFVIARSISDPLYHLAVVVDDHEMGITHVLRAEDHVSNTPRQILIQEALGYERPVYAHLPLILAPDKSKLSKRKHNASIEVYREQGFLPEAFVNYLALLGWNPGTPQEIFTMQELIETFTLRGVQKGGAIFDIEKLRWVNREHLLKMSERDFNTIAAEYVAHGGILESAWVQQLMPLLRERVSVWGDIEPMFKEGGELHFLASEPNIDMGKISWRREGIEVTKKHLKECRNILTEAPAEAFESPESTKELLWPYADSEGRGSVLWPLRYVLTGQEKSPDPFTVIYILGTQKTVERIDRIM
jgi:glutamyl-tRNA synthetase